ncbi:MAG: T9SS type A sorting domain-containing protein [Candidatus Latescibacteria bacterium]|nr:T9SS type A sorting domain-containing protein [bacterium]MBD3424027.1 T9SS type A sorting domain-containing protein [Candidatus Latescibacterota bacterium]
MKRIAISLFSAILFCILVFPAAAHSQPDEEWITRNLKIVLEVLGIEEPDTCSLFGKSYYKFRELFPGTTESDIDTTSLTGWNPRFGNLKMWDGDLPTIGQSIEITPGIDFPAESFFDVYFELELPDLLPGDTLVNYSPVHIESIIDDMPPYFDKYVSTGGPVTLYNTMGDPVAEILYWEEEFIPYSEPEADLMVDTYYRSEIAEIDEATGMIQVSMGMSGGLQPDYVTFYWRPAGTSDPYIEFAMDPDGNAPIYSTSRPLGDGDGFSGYLDPYIYNPNGEDIELKGCAYSPEGTYCDSLIVTVDPTPPLPMLPSFPPDSLGLFFPDSMHPVTCVNPDEDVDTVEAYVFPLATEKHRDLTSINMYGLGTPEDSMACAPTAAASCLDYFARNGHPELKHPKGDTSKPEQSPKDTAKELIGRMNTDKDKGTSALNMAKGIKQHLKEHGKTGWTVDGELVNDYHDIGSMFREFEADKEDVMMLVKDKTVNAAGDTVEVGHFVTLGSKSSTFYTQEYEWGHVSGISYRLDFMDPMGGGSTANNEYNVGEEDGKPTLEGYSFGGMGPVTVRGYIKVSPPEGGGGGNKMLRSSGSPAAPASDGWIKVDSKPASGMGLPDTLYWNTSGFEPGTYLLEVRATDATGHTVREIRLCGIPFFTVDTDDDSMTPTPSGLMGSYPNPFNPSTTIMYSVASKGPVSIKIYDVSGRLVRKLLDGKVVEAGQHKVSWNGINGSGSHVASGAYFCRMVTAGKSSSIKVILLR